MPVQPIDAAQAFIIEKRIRNVKTGGTPKFKNNKLQGLEHRIKRINASNSIIFRIFAVGRCCRLQ